MLLGIREAEPTPHRLENVHRAWKALMVMGFQGHSGAQWASCCPWLFKAPVLAVPDHSPKEAGIEWLRTLCGAHGQTS